MRAALNSILSMEKAQPLQWLCFFLMMFGREISLCKVGL